MAGARGVPPPTQKPAVSSTAPDTPAATPAQAKSELPAATPRAPDVLEPVAPAAPGPQIPTGAQLADALEVIGGFLDDPRFTQDEDKIRSAGPERIRQYNDAFKQRLQKLADEYARSAKDPAQAAVFQRKFGALEGHLKEAGHGLEADDFFQAGAAGPLQLAARIQWSGSATDAALFVDVQQMVEKFGAQIQAAKVRAQTPLDPAAVAQAAAQVEAARSAAGAAWWDAVNQWGAAQGLSLEQTDRFAQFGLARLDAIETDAKVNLYPTRFSPAIGSPQWEAALDTFIPKERPNQRVEIFREGQDYLDRMVNNIGASKHFLCLEMMELEKDHPSLSLTDDLSVKVTKARSAFTTASMINRIAAKKLEMPYELYQELRMEGHLEASQIRDLRMAQRLLYQEMQAKDPNAPQLSILSKEVADRTRALLAQTSAGKRRRMMHTLFPFHARVLMDGKGPDFELLAGLWNDVGLARGFAQNHLKELVDIVKGYGTQAEQEGPSVGIAAGNDAEPLRYVKDVLGIPLRSAEALVEFNLHPIRYAFGDVRDLQDISDDIVEYQNPIFDKKGLLVHPKALFDAVLQNQHKKLLYTDREDGSVHIMETGMHLGAKYWPFVRHGVQQVNWADAGVEITAGKDSIAQDVVSDLVADLNSSAKVYEGEKPYLETEASWLPTTDERFADAVPARHVSVSAKRQRGAVSLLMAGLGSVNKDVYIEAPFFSGDAFIKQIIAVADRWKREGWDPGRSKTEYQPDAPGWDGPNGKLWDPAIRRLVVKLPGWMDTGVSQGASYKARRVLMEHGVTVVTWRPKPGTVSGDGVSIYGPKAFDHGKNYKLLSVDYAKHTQAGFILMGSLNPTNPVAAGKHDEIGFYSEAPSVLDQFDARIVRPGLEQSVPAKKTSKLVTLVDDAIGFATRFWQ